MLILLNMNIIATFSSKPLKRLSKSSDNSKKRIVKE